MSSSIDETRDEIISRHKKELKVFDGEKRSALKKVKGSAGKGKKGKEALAVMEADYGAKEVQMEQRHSTELEFSQSAISAEENEESSSLIMEAPTSQQPDFDQDSRKQTKTKAQRRKEKLRASELERERQIEEELANGGPSPRDVENGHIEATLAPLKLRIHDIKADGHCLYSAIAHQVGSTDYTAIRQLCAKTMIDDEEEYSPFCELDDEHSSYDEYVKAVENSARWGGQLELRVLSLACKRPVYVYSTDPVVVMGEEYDGNEAEPIRVSYHRYYYALGAHYNSIIVDEGC